MPIVPYDIPQCWNHTPSMEALSKPFLTAASPTQLRIEANTYLKLINAAQHKVIPFIDAYTVTLASILDTGAVQAGKDYYLYLIANGPLIASLNSTYPAGYDTLTSRKIGQLHTLCANAGTISGHPLSDFVAGNILPASVSCLNHRPRCAAEGMVYSESLHLWCDIYLPSGTGSSTRSAYAAVITDSRVYPDLLNDLAAVGKRPLRDYEYQVTAAGSNEGTNISGSADPNTTGGHSDTAGRRILSNLGGEDFVGVMYQWLLTQSTKWDGTGGWQWVNPGGSKGELYLGGNTNDVKLMAGGCWNGGAHCGSRCQDASNHRWNAASNFTTRGCAEPLL